MYSRDREKGREKKVRKRKIGEEGKSGPGNATTWILDTLELVVVVVET